MKLKILLPTHVLFEGEVTKVTAEAQNGSFCLLPKHVDFTAALAPGLLSFELKEKGEEFLAVDEGILVKCGQDVFISTTNAVRGKRLGSLKQTVEDQFKSMDEQENKIQLALSKLEASFIRHFMEIGG